MSEMPSGKLIRDTITGILESAEFKPRKKLSEYISELLNELLFKLFDRVGEMSLLPILIMVGLAVVIIVLVIFFVVRARRSRRLKGEQAAVEQVSWEYGYAELLRVAADLAARGELDNALVCLFLAHIKALSAQGLLIIEKGKTNLQYEHELMLNGYNDARRFREFKNIFNAVRYGYRNIDIETFKAWQSYCVASLEKEDAA